VEAVSIRLSMLVILISSLFLYTSYTATIVALLQSPAALINNVEEFSKSSLTMGIENLFYEKQLIQVQCTNSFNTFFSCDPYGRVGEPSLQPSGLLCTSV